MFSHLRTFKILAQMFPAAFVVLELKIFETDDVIHDSPHFFSEPKRFSSEASISSGNWLEISVFLVSLSKYQRRAFIRTWLSLIRLMYRSRYSLSMRSRSAPGRAQVLRPAANELRPLRLERPRGYLQFRFLWHLGSVSECNMNWVAKSGKGINAVATNYDFN